MKNVTIHPVEKGRFADIANRLRALRGHFDMQSKDFAAAADIEPKSYSQWESGNHRLSLSGALAIGAKYGVSLDWLYLGRLDTLPSNLRSALASSPLVITSKKSNEIADLDDA